LVERVWGEPGEGAEAPVVVGPLFEIALLNLSEIKRERDRQTDRQREDTPSVRCSFIKSAITTAERVLIYEEPASSKRAVSSHFLAASTLWSSKTSPGGWRILS
jgi:hypothetical protein